MKNQAPTGNPSTFQEWASFMSVLNGSKHSDKPLLKKTESSYRLVFNLEKQLEAK